MFSEKDAMQLMEKGISRQQLEWQLEMFHNGVPEFRLDREATIKDGIIKLSDSDLEKHRKFYDEIDGLSVIKFVPASGAASRMFKGLYEFIEASGKKADPGNRPFIQAFFGNLSKFAFYNDLKKLIEKKGYSMDLLITGSKFTQVLQFLLEKKGLNYGNLPKGILKFHAYPNEMRTPFEEHMVEGALYASKKGNPVRLHFTVSSESLNAFGKLLNEKIEDYEKRFSVRFEVSFSIQKPSSDTMAVDAENKPFRNDDGSILFRPGGHGALIDNLNDLDADLIFIKNIDNVVQERFSGPTVLYKKALAGKLIELQSKVFRILKELNNSAINTERAEEILSFVRQELSYEPKDIPNLTDSAKTIQFFKNILDRPMRVCGVVKNSGEPGGGPYWAPNSQGNISLQIVEFSQVNNADTSQVEIFKKATHFNPVDLVCSPRRFDGTKFDLTKFVDNNTCFISQKSKEGKILKALELPGLWNGAMADWNTLMIEVPAETFNPVKTVNDLLRPLHQ